MSDGRSHFKGCRSPCSESHLKTEFDPSGSLVSELEVKSHIKGFHMNSGLLGEKIPVVGSERIHFWICISNNIVF